MTGRWSRWTGGRALYTGSLHSKNAWGILRPVIIKTGGSYRQVVAKAGLTVHNIPKQLADDHT